LLTRKVQASTKEGQRHLSLKKNEQVIVITRSRAEDGVPLVYERIAIPARKFANLSIEAHREMIEELYVLYQKQCGKMVRAADDQVEIDLAPAPVGKELNIAAGSPVILVKRVAVSLSNKPIEFRQSWTSMLRYTSHLE
jgi:GntR family transcriptional regulator